MKTPCSSLVLLLIASLAAAATAQTASSAAAMPAFNFSRPLPQNASNGATAFVDVWWQSVSIQATALPLDTMAWKAFGFSMDSWPNPGPSNVCFCAVFSFESNPCLGAATAYCTKEKNPDQAFCSNMLGFAVLAANSTAAAKVANFLQSTCFTPEQQQRYTPGNECSCFSAPGSFDCALAKLTSCKAQSPLCPTLTLGTYANVPQMNAARAYANTTCTQADSTAGPDGICACATGLHTSPGCVSATKSFCAKASGTAAQAFCKGMSASAAGKQQEGDAAAVAGYLASTCMADEEMVTDPCACYEAPSSKGCAMARLSACKSGDALCPVLTLGPQAAPEQLAEAGQYLQDYCMGPRAVVVRLNFTGVSADAFQSQYASSTLQVLSQLTNTDTSTIRQLPSPSTLPSASLAAAAAPDSLVGGRRLAQQASAAPVAPAAAAVVSVAYSIKAASPSATRAAVTAAAANGALAKALADAGVPVQLSAVSVDGSPLQLLGSDSAAAAAATGAGVGGEDCDCLSKGAIAGVVIGSAVGGVGLVALAWVLARRCGWCMRRRGHMHSATSSDTGVWLPSLSSKDMSDAERRSSNDQKANSSSMLNPLTNISAFQTVQSFTPGFRYSTQTTTAQPTPRLLRPWLRAPGGNTTAAPAGAAATAATAAPPGSARSVLEPGAYVPPAIRTRAPSTEEYRSAVNMGSNFGSTSEYVDAESEMTYGTPRSGFTYTTADSVAEGGRYVFNDAHSDS